MQADFQREFSQKLFRPSEQTPANLRNAKGQATNKRFNVYRNNVVAGLKDAIKDGFPLTERLVGQEFFDAMAFEYVKSHPPSSPLMFLYGENFPDFIASFAPAQSVPYLPDFAKFEYQRRLAYFAADGSAPIELEHGQLDLDALAEEKLSLQPSVQVLSSQFPVFDIYQRLMGRNQELSGPQTVLTYRPRSEVKSLLAPPYFEAFVSLLSEFNLGEAVARILKAHPDADAPIMISLALQASMKNEQDI